MGTAHAAPGVKQLMSSYGRLATICNAMPAPVWRCILLSAVVTVVSEVFASAISQGLPMRRRHEYDVVCFASPTEAD